MCEKKSKLAQACELSLQENEINCDVKIEFSKRHKRRINRIFREIGSKKIIYPEVDNYFERIRSRIITKVNIFFAR